MKLTIKPWTINLSDKEIMATPRDKYIKGKVKELAYTKIPENILTEKTGEIWDLAHGKDKKDSPKEAPKKEPEATKEAM